MPRACVRWRRRCAISKPPKPPPPTKPDPHTISLRQRHGETPEAVVARCAVAPETQAALTVREYTSTKGAELTMDSLIAELAAQGKAGNNGDLAQGERMLVGQAHALDAIFGFCARRARGNVGEHPQTADLYLRLALRAQAQCRATWETLAAIKNPAPVAFVRQANIAAGPQQINNGLRAPARAGETDNAPSKLEGPNYAERMDTRAPGTVRDADPAVATVGTLDGAEIRRG